MVYKNRNGQPRERAMVAAYSLVEEFGASQTSVAAALGCSQPTVSNWIKEVKHETTVATLNSQLNDAKQYIEQLKSQIDQQGALIEHQAVMLEHQDDYEREDEDEDDFVPDYGYEDPEDNFEHALDDVLKNSGM